MTVPVLKSIKVHYVESQLFIQKNLNTDQLFRIHIAPPQTEEKTDRKERVNTEV